MNNHINLQTPEKFPGALTVTQLNEYVKRIIDGTPQLNNVYVKGEISNFKNHYSTGHYYFTLKDEGGQLRSVMFKSAAAKMQFIPEDGMKVTAHGRISSFVRDGTYQLYCDAMEPDGIGALYVAFEQLKRKLEHEGLFDPARYKQALACLELLDIENKDKIVAAVSRNGAVYEAQQSMMPAFPAGGTQ